MESLLSLLLKHHPCCASLLPVSHLLCSQLSLQHRGSVDHKELYYVCLILGPNSEKEIAQKQTREALTLALILKELTLPIVELINQQGMLQK